MKTITITMLVIAIGFQSSISRAAIYTSSSVLNQSFFLDFVSLHQL